MPKSSKKSRAPRPARGDSEARRPVVEHARLWAWASAAVFVVIVVAVYGRAIDGPFIFDDYNSVETNSTIVQLWPLVGDATNPGPLYTPQFAPTSARPVVNLSLALNYYFGGLNPDGYRLVDMALHAMSAMLLFGIVRRTLRLPYFGSRFDSAADWLALATALLWALHPLQTEAVVYVTQRTELMMGFFYLATLYCSLRYWTSPNESVPQEQESGQRIDPLLPRAITSDRVGWLVLASLACLAGMGSKEVMVSAPLVVLLFERTFVAGTLEKALRESWPLYVGLACGWLLLLFLNYDSPHRDSAGFQQGLPAYVWWFTQSKMLLMYLKLVVWPWPLVIHYELPYLRTLGEAWPYLLAVSLLGLATLVWLWRNHPAGFLGTCVFAILSPTLVVPIVSEVAAERRMYLPLAAIIVLVVVGSYVLAQSYARRQGGGNQSAKRAWSPLVVVVATSLIVATVWAAVSTRRLASYASEMLLWQEVVQLQPENHVALQNLGVEHYNMGDLAAAASHCRESVRIKPDSSGGHYSLALVLSKLGEREEASEHFRLAAKHNPDSPELLNNYGVSQFVLGQNDESISTFEEVIRLKPTMWRAHENLGKALVRAGQMPEAIAAFKQALTLNPEALASSGHLALAQAQMGQPAEAIATAEAALKVAKATGAHAMAARIETDLATYRASLANADTSNTGPNADGPTHSN